MGTHNIISNNYIKIEWGYSNLRKHTATMAKVFFFSIGINCHTSASVRPVLRKQTLATVYISYV
jgi:hypothetical protein